MGPAHDLSQDPQDPRVAILESELAAARERLDEAEDTIRAIRRGEVDAFVVQLQHGQRIYSLRGSEHVYHAFVDQMRDGAVTVAEDNTVMYANRRFFEMLGLPRSRVIGTNLIDHIAPEDGYLSEALIQRAQQRESSAELSLVGRDGSRVPIHIFAFPVDLEGLRTVCVLVTDLTEIHRYRYDLERMVESRTSELMEQAEELRRITDAKNQLVARLAIELEKPVRDMQQVTSDFAPTSSELAHDEKVELSRSAASLMENSLIRLNALLQDTQMLGEVESGNARLEYTVTRLRELAAACVEEARSSASEKGVEILLHAPPEDVSFITDGEKLKQVVVTLLLLCAESVETGPVRLTVQATPELMARFEVCVPAGGLPLDDIENIFGGDMEPDSIRRISERVPALSIWGTLRMAQFMRGNVQTAHQDEHDCLILSVPM